MNLQKLKTNVGWLVQLEPVTCRLDENDRELEAETHDWTITAVTEAIVEISNVRTGHIAQLGKDHIHNFTTIPGRASGGVEYGFLMLNVQIYVQGNRVWVRPNSRPGQRVPPYGESPAERFLRSRLLDGRFQMILQDYKVSGDPQSMIETFPDLTQKERAELYDRAVMSKKKRPSKNNPYK